MQKIKIAEIFYSLQGEGLYTGVPSVFIRTFGCNFQCRGFGLPEGKYTAEPDSIALDFEVKHPEWKYEDLPLAETGCDSYASWHPAFKKLSPVMTTDEITSKVKSLVPDIHPAHIHIVITGGEPLLGWQRAYPELLEKLGNAGFRNITFETNGTQALHEDLRTYMLRRSAQSINGQYVTFSVSAKLPCSGETVGDALKPNVVVDYSHVGPTYLKFVVGERKDLEDVEKFIKAYVDAGWRGEVYLMPVGGISTLYNITAPEVAKYCMEKGYRYSPRLQVDIWKNAWGT